MKPRSGQSPSPTVKPCRPSRRARPASRARAVSINFARRRVMSRRSRATQQQQHQECSATRYTGRSLRNPSASTMNPEVPISSLPGSAYSDDNTAYCDGGVLCAGQAGHEGDQRSAVHAQREIVEADDEREPRLSAGRAPRRALGQKSIRPLCAHSSGMWQAYDRTWHRRHWR